jgi:Na+-transporting methylmalonyl-CoA/oxaloacetate decarboxylase gamma subunit
LNEGAQYRTYLGIGVVLIVLGILPLLVSAFQGKSR